MWGKSKQAPTRQEPVDDGRTIEELQREIDTNEGQIAAAEKRMLQTAAKTRDCGAATLEQLHAQREQIKHIKMQQKAIGTNLKTTDKMMHSLESLSGAFLTMVGFHRGHDEKAHYAASRVVEEPSESVAAVAEISERRVGKGAKPPAPADQDAMGQLSSVVAELRAQADEMNTELKAQNKELDGMAAKAEDHKHQLKKSNKRARKILGEKKAGKGNEEGDDGFGLPGTGGIASLYPSGI